MKKISIIKKLTANHRMIFLNEGFNENVRCYPPVEPPRSAAFTHGENGFFHANCLLNRCMSEIEIDAPSITVSSRKRFFPCSRSIFF